MNFCGGSTNNMPSIPERLRKWGRFFLVRSSGVEQGEFWIAKVPPDAQDGDTIQFSPEDAIFQGNGSKAGDWMGAGVAKSEVEQGHDVGMIINEDEETEGPDLDVEDDEGDT